MTTIPVTDNTMRCMIEAKDMRANGRNLDSLMRLNAAMFFAREECPNLLPEIKAAVHDYRILILSSGFKNDGPLL